MLNQSFERGLIGSELKKKQNKHTGRRDASVFRYQYQISYNGKKMGSEINKYIYYLIWGNKAKDGMRRERETGR